ncbi:MAG TPA: hypothetical protein VG733_03125, partial [Chthoniobacteraceae bacterium]|nr:hypothetical protein [Chthoniobacteraceae bacterium]
TTLGAPAPAPSQARKRSLSPGLRGLFKSGVWGSGSGGGNLKDEVEPSPSVLRGSRLFEDAGDGTPDPQSDQSPEYLARWEERGTPDLVARLKKLRKQARGVVFLDTDNGSRLLDAICHCIVTDQPELAASRIKLLGEMLLVTRSLNDEQKAARLWLGFLDQHYCNTPIYPAIRRLFPSYH